MKRRQSISAWGLGIACSVCLLVGGGDAQEPAWSAADQPLAREIAGVLDIQTRAWNDGDLERFMSTYWKSAALTFCSGGEATRGWQATLDRYRKNYAPPKQMGKLRFDHLEIMPIEQGAALALGQWHLAMPDDSRRDGNFTLVLKRMAGKWKIIHDHSSLREPDEEP